VSWVMWSLRRSTRSRRLREMARKTIRGSRQSVTALCHDDFNPSRKRRGLDAAQLKRKLFWSRRLRRGACHDGMTRSWRVSGEDNTSSPSAGADGLLDSTAESPSSVTASQGGFSYQDSQLKFFNSSAPNRVFCRTANRSAALSSEPARSASRATPIRAPPCDRGPRAPNVEFWRVPYDITSSRSMLGPSSGTLVQRCCSPLIFLLLLR